MVPLLLHWRRGGLERMSTVTGLRWCAAEWLPGELAAALAAEMSMRILSGLFDLAAQVLDQPCTSGVRCGPDGRSQTGWSKQICRNHQDVYRHHVAALGVA